MAARQSSTRKQRSRKGDDQPREDERPEDEERDDVPRDQERNGGSEEDGGNGAGGVDEAELAEYLTERIKPGLNRGSIPLLARAIAREIARDDYHRDEPEDEPDEEDEGEGGGASDLEGDLHQLQQRLGSDWILLYAVHEGQAWLIAETETATQRIEAPRPDVLVQAARLLSERGGRPGTQGGDED